MARAYWGTLRAASVRAETSITNSLPSTCAGNAYRIAAARLPNGRNVDRRSAVAANHVRAILAVTGPSADHAGIQSGSPGAVGLANDDEAQRSVVRFDLEKMQIAVAYPRVGICTAPSCAVTVCACGGAADTRA